MGLGFLLGIGANILLFWGWLAWSHSAWADCPWYAFGLGWYPIPPMPVVAYPFMLAGPGLVLFLLRLAISAWRKQVRQSMVNGSGLLLNAVPFVVTIGIPLISDWLGKTTPGC